MLIKRIEIKNFRSIEHAVIDIDRLTLVIGRNGSGKSTLLRALEYFYSLTATVQDMDYFGKNTDLEIEIALTFTDLTEQEHSFFRSNVVDGELKVVKIFNSLSPQGRYHSFSMQVPEFVSIRQIATKSGQLAAYRDLQGQFRLPNARSADDALEALKGYEDAHPDRCVVAPMPGQFLGPRNVGGGSLDKFTRFVLIPASISAENEVAGKSGALSDLVNAIAATYKDREDVAKAAEEYKAKVSQIFDNNSDQNKLLEVSEGINKVLEDYAENATLRLAWNEAEEPSLKLPDVIREIVEGNLGVDIKRVGHGLQRTLIIAILQYMALREAPQEGDYEIDIVLAFEEPELYQHPSKCKFLSNLFRDLTNNSRTQIMAVTHSPYFVDPTDVRSLLYARKIDSGFGDMKTTSFTRLDSELALDRLAGAMNIDRASMSIQSLIAFSKPVFNSVVCEGFFADRVVLVEGETEAGVFSAAQQYLELDWERKGVTVIPCGGKTKMDKPRVIFEGLGIKCFVVFDWDSNNKKSDEQYNFGYQRLSGLREINIEDERTSIILGDNLIFYRKIEDYLKEQCGHDFEKIADTAAKATGNESLSIANAMKRAETAREFILIACREYAKDFPLIWDFVRMISAD